MHQQMIHQLTKKLKMVNESEAQRGHLKILKWIIESYRPISIVEDLGFNDVLTFANTLEKKYTAPSRSTITRLLCSTYNNVMVSIKGMIAQECHFYALTSDIWSSRTSEAYILLMIYYLTR